MHIDDSANFARLLRSSGLRDAELEPIFGVSQSTVSRLKNAKIKRVKRYVVVWDRHIASGGMLFVERMRELQQRALRDDKLRNLLISLHSVMQDA